MLNQLQVFVEIWNVKVHRTLFPNSTRVPTCIGGKRQQASLAHLLYRGELRKPVKLPTHLDPIVALEKAMR